MNHLKGDDEKGFSIEGMDTDILQKPNVGLVLTLLLEGKKKMTDLHKYIRNYASLKLLVMDLKEKGYVNIEESEKGKKVIYVSLTDKGWPIAKMFEEALKIANGMIPAPVELKVGDILTIVASKGNTKLEDAKMIHITVRKEGKYLQLWCEQDKTHMCDHIRYLLHRPEIYDGLLVLASKEGAELPKEYRDVENYILMKNGKPLESEIYIFGKANKKLAWPIIYVSNVKEKDI